MTDLDHTAKLTFALPSGVDELAMALIVEQDGRLVVDGECGPICVSS
jgi:hypothetical protein